MSSPRLNAVTCLGSMLLSSCCLLYGLQVYTQYHRFASTLLCQVRVWFLVCSFSLVLMPIVAKCWRVNRIFKKAAFKRVVIKDLRLLILVGIHLCFDITFMTLWQSLDPLKHQSIPIIKEVSKLKYPVNETNILTVHGCSCEFESIWMSVLLIYKSSILSYGFYIAWQIRNITLPSMDDAKPLIMIILAVFILYNCSVVLRHLFQERPIVLNCLLTLIIWIAALNTQCVTFIPKILLLRKNKSKLETPVSNSFKYLTHPKKELSYDEFCHLVMENSALQRSIQVKEQLIQNLEQHLATFQNNKLTRTQLKGDYNKTNEIDGSPPINNKNVKIDYLLKSTENLKNQTESFFTDALKIDETSLSGNSDKFKEYDTSISNQADTSPQIIVSNVSFLRNSATNGHNQVNSLSPILKVSTSRDLNISHKENTWFQDSITFQKTDIAGSITQSYDLSDDSDTYSYVSSYVPTWTPTLAINQHKHHDKRDYIISLENTTTLANDKLYPGGNCKVSRLRKKRRRQKKSNIKKTPKTVYTIPASRHTSDYNDNTSNTIEKINPEDIMV
ncbi:uncharacterized protein LOC115212258 [Argonauta hians]